MITMGFAPSHPSGGLSSSNPYPFASGWWPQVCYSACDFVPVVFPLLSPKVYFLVLMPLFFAFHLPLCLGTFEMRN